MSEIEIKIEENRFLKLRLVSLLLLFLVLYIVLLSRAFQLQILSSQIIKERYNQQHAKSLETRKSITDLQQSLDKLSTDQKKLVTDTIILGAEKGKLLKEIDELKPQYIKLSNDIQLLQKTLRDLSILQEKESEQILTMYDQIYRKENWVSKWANSFMTFLSGIIASIIASIIYSSVAIRRKMSLLGYLIKTIKDRLIHMKKE